MTIVGQTIKKVVQALLPELKAWFMEQVRQFEQQLDTLASPEADLLKETIELEFINKQELVSIAQKHIVPGSDGVAVLRTKEKDKEYLLLIYVKGRELLSPENDSRVLIVSQLVSRDIHELFGNEELIILG